ncbi:two pore potassium channel c-like protein isoform X3 [Cinnamomum micranthum f. kanehirae]|uniref:Two pore potassium channel c-like protein isoform X3 n=1 Tax=Cinnamomum micranthum f. kanehirae TaxID=337451 RepID=A0A3S3MZ37_9MAGN|nr:two pore potassium channel c-like protein isoform X3 [Cinnamomum micranthum f. kanehirae]
MDEPLLSKSVDESTKTDKEHPPGFLNLNSSLLQLQDPRLPGSDVISPVATGRSFIRSTHNSSFINLITNLSKKRILTHRSHSAPSLLTDSKEAPPDFANRRPALQATPSIVTQAFFGIFAYVGIGAFVYVMKSEEFKGNSTFRLVDALYFSVVTLCTIGYGDIVPDTTFTKIFTCLFILVGFGFIDILLHGLVTYVLDRQEAVLLSTMDHNWRNPLFNTYIMDMKKGRMRIRMKVGLALAVVIGCIVVAMVMAHVLEDLNWLDSFYLSVSSVTTVGYGDYAFKSTLGRIFATIWLLVSTLAVARAFLYLTELRIDKRNRKVAKWVLQKKMTIGDLVAADLDNDGCISKAEYVIYKLKEMGRIAEKDILQICNQFDGLDTINCGKITLSDLMESQH